MARKSASGTLTAFDALRESIGENDDKPRVYVPTGFSVLDYGILKRGGLPDGRLIELYGPTEGGKSLFATDIARHKQLMDPDRALMVIDTEYSFDIDFYASRGLDVSPNKFILKRTNVAEEAVNLAVEAVESGAIHTLVIDSIGNTEGSQYMQGKRFERDKTTKALKTDQLGIQAAITGKMAKRLAAGLYEYECLGLGVNQIREAINTGFGASRVTDDKRPGGRVWEHNRHVAIKLQRVAYLYEGGLKTGKEPIGIEVKATVRRSKVSATGQTHEGTHLKMYFAGQHVGRVIEAMDAAIRLGILEQRGPNLAWESAGLQWRGKKLLNEDLESDATLLDNLTKEIQESLKSTNMALGPEALEEDENIYDEA